MQPGFLVAAAAAAAVAAYQDAGFCSPGCHGCTREVVPSNLLLSLSTVVITAAWTAAQNAGLAQAFYFIFSFAFVIILLTASDFLNIFPRLLLFIVCPIDVAQDCKASVITA